MTVVRSDCIFQEIPPVWGRWWKAGTEVDFNNPQTFMTGRLTGSCASGFELEVDDSDEAIWGDAESYSVLGSTTGGRLLTLLNCQCVRNSPIGENPRCVYRPSVIFDGGHFSTPEDLDFCRISFGLNGLEQWIDPRIELPSVNDEMFTTVRLSPLLHVDVLDTDVASVCIDESRTHFHKRGALRFSIESILRVDIRLHEGKSTTWGFFERKVDGNSFSSLANTVKEVLSMASTAPIYIYDLTVFSKKHTRKIDDRVIYDQIKVYWNTLIRGDRKAYEKVGINDWIIEWSDIKKDPKSYFGAWHTSKKTLDYVESLFSAAKTEKTMLADQRFTDLFAGVNGLFEALYPEAISDNALMTRDGLGKIIKDYCPFFFELLGDQSRVDEITDHIFSLGHTLFLGRSPSSLLSEGYGPRIVHLNFLLVAIIRSGLMSKAGFSIDEIRGASRKDRHVRWALESWMKSNERKQ